MSPTRRRVIGSTLSLAAVLLLAVGWWTAEWRAGSTDIELREQLLRQSIEMSRTLSPELVRRLAFSPEDKGTPAFEIIREQMIAYSRLIMQRGIYSMALREGRLVFGPENYPEDDPMASPPGTVYEEPGEQDFDIFRTGEPFTSGPQTDEYGTFISAMAPVIDPHSGEVLMAVGIDILADEWKSVIRKAWWAPILATSALTAFLLSGAAALFLRKRIGVTYQRRLRHLETVLSGVVGLMLTAGIVFLFVEAKQRERSEIFAKYSGARTAAVREALLHHGKDVATIARFFEGSDHVDYREFAGFVEPLAKGSAVHAYAWAPFVSAEERERAEAEPQNTGSGPLSIWERGGQGQKVAASHRAAYFPVSYVEPWAGNEAAVGFDLGSEPRRLQAMERSLRTGLETVSEQIPLNGILDRQGMVCLRPVFKNGTPTVDKGPGRLLGFALGVLQPQALLERVFKGYETGKSPVAVHLVDLMGGREPELLAVHPQEHLLHHPSVVNEIYLQHYPLHQVLPIFLFGRGFAIVSHPTEAFFAAHPIRAGWLAGSLGFFVTGVLTVLVGFLRSRQGSLERQVAHRTAELQESRQRIETLLEVTKTGVNVIDDRFNLLYVDPGLQKLYGDPGGRKCHEYFMALEGPCPWCAAETSLRTRAIQVVEQTLPRENHRPVEVHTVPFRNSSGQWMVAELKVDITERKRALEELRRLAEAMGQTSEAIVITTPQGVIEYVNPAFEQITGFSEEEAVGETPRILKSGSHDEAFYKKFWSTLLSGDRWTGRIVNRRKDGVPYTAECSISPVRNERNDLAHFVWVSRDITRELALEERFRQSERLESVGRLAAGVAHDMNNLLTPILGYGEILLMELDPSSESYRQAQVIRESAERSRDLIRQLLAFGRKQVLEVTATDLRRLVRDMEKLMRRTIRENIALEIRTDGPCPIMSDAGQIGQVLMNLAVNAQDAMPQGGNLIMEVSPVQLEESYCQTHGGLKPGKYAMLSVTDTGVGMDQETLRLIFEPFFSTKKELGTGLGLATVYGIVNQHDGHISVYSEPDRGTVFKVYLPLIQEADLSPQLKRPAMELRGSETILVVEDNELPRNLACRILERQGYTALSAAGGQEALELLETHPDTPVHLLLTDVVMPNMDGKSLSRQLCSKYSHLKVIYMSGYTQEVIDRHGILEEGVHFIQKPFSVASLSEKVRQVLDSSVS